jgi:tetratricopeptide (TPR) repeat protein
VIAGFAIVLSGTRGALAGLVIGALFVAMRERLNWRWLAGGLALMAMMAAFYVSPAGERLRARVHWSSEDPLGGSRLLLWRDTLRMSGGRLLAGYGPETFAVEFPRYQSLELARAYPDFYHESPHNIFLDALVSKGILGLLPLVALAVLGLKLARGPMGGAFVAILASQQFIAFTVPTELYFYLCLAILAGKKEKKEEKKEKKGSDDFSPSRALAAVEKVVCPLFLGCFAVYLAAGDALLGSARRALDRGDVAAAVESVDRARKWNASADIYFSRRLLNVKAFEPALETAQHATQTADDPQNAWVNLAAFYAVQNNAAAVELSLRQAIAAAPNWYKSHWLLAQVLDREGRLAEAKAEAQAAVERNGGKTPEVTQVWEQLKRR